MGRIDKLIPKPIKEHIKALKRVRGFEEDNADILEEYTLILNELKTLEEKSKTWVKSKGIARAFDDIEFKLTERKTKIIDVKALLKKFPGLETETIDVEGKDTSIIVKEANPKALTIWADNNNIDLSDFITVKVSSVAVTIEEKVHVEQQHS
ncbi:hypothetical protein LCGC14_0147210 [marine sediment metagenome]|uniref:Uncharacterized protein n=1 Tax=marine sediment metagenome TaxID=412755 RepID=A0A0F9V3N2_9ZZZZ